MASNPNEMHPNRIETSTPPIHSLPSELLERIFIILAQLEHRRITRHSGFTIARGRDPYSWDESLLPNTGTKTRRIQKPDTKPLSDVCERWKGIVDASSHLWYVPVGVHFKERGMEAGTQLRRFEENVRNNNEDGNGNCDIYAWIASEFQDGSLLAPDSQQNSSILEARCVLQALRILSEPSIRARLSVLVVRTYSSNFATQILRFVPTFATGRCPRLEWFNVYCITIDDIQPGSQITNPLSDRLGHLLPPLPPFTRTISKLPALYHMEIEIPCFCTIPPSLPLPVGPGLEEARILLSKYSNSNELEWEVVSHVLRNAPNLRSLELYLHHVLPSGSASLEHEGWISDPKHTCGLISKLGLEISSLVLVHLFREFSFPSVTHLSLQLTDQHTTLPTFRRKSGIADQCITLPSVRRLEFVSTSRLGSNLMEFLVFPNLRELLLQDSFGLWGSEVSFPLPIEFAASPEEIQFDVTKMSGVWNQLKVLNVSRLRRLVLSVGHFEEDVEGDLDPEMVRARENSVLPVLEEVSARGIPTKMLFGFLAVLSTPALKFVNGRGQDHSYQAFASASHPGGTEDRNGPTFYERLNISIDSALGVFSQPTCSHIQVLEMNFDVAYLGESRVRKGEVDAAKLSHLSLGWLSRGSEEFIFSHFPRLRSLLIYARQILDESWRAPVIAELTSLKTARAKHGSPLEDITIRDDSGDTIIA
jgi:hypothetical protein